MKLLKVLAVVVLFFVFLAGSVSAQEVGDKRALYYPESTLDGRIPIYIFERDDCGFCQAEKLYLEHTYGDDPSVWIIEADIVESEAARLLYQEFTAAFELSRVTPITVIGNRVILGFDSSKTTGVEIAEALAHARSVIERGDSLPTVEGLIVYETGMIGGESQSACDSDDVCEVDFGQDTFMFDLPFVGPTDVGTFSLSTLAVVLGFVDGFNPCAMWVLITFLLILLQVSDRKRMFQIAGLFILAESIMYALILNVWYKTWDFVGLDQIVTPIVGIVALGGGIFFLRKYIKSIGKPPVCDITDIEQQGKIEAKITAIASKPLTIVSALGIIGIAFSVNVIEFACSIGIPQAFTKILEINELGWFGTQWYIGLYTLFYMVDDLIVFGLALWGFDKLHASHKYTNLSMLIGGVLMLILGSLLIFAPTVLTL